MDSNELERERGIAILAKVTSIPRIALFAGPPILRRSQSDAASRAQSGLS